MLRLSHIHKLTQQQNYVLVIISRAPKPLTIHEILEQLLKFHAKANRMSIHRALDSLIKFGFIHKIQVNNSYTLCRQVSDHSCQIFICLNCGKQIEIHSHQVCQAFELACAEHQFKLVNPLEITGFCQGCYSKGEQSVTG